jgi:hypothetical protein
LQLPLLIFFAAKRYCHCELFYGAAMIHNTDVMFRDFREWLDVYQLYFCGERGARNTPWSGPRFSNDEIVNEYLALNPQHEAHRTQLSRWLMRRNPSRQLYLARAMNRFAGELMAN